MHDVLKASVLVMLVLLSLFALLADGGTVFGAAPPQASFGYGVDQGVGNGTARDPSLVESNGDYVYETSYGKFTFSGTTPLNYSLTPDQIGSTILYSAIWLNASMLDDEHANFPYIGSSSILEVSNTFFHSTTEVCGSIVDVEAGCDTVIANLEMSWNFYSGWVAPKLSITLTQTDLWNPMRDWPPERKLPPLPWPHDYGVFHMFWIHEVTLYTNWAIQGQCANQQINVQTPIAMISQESGVALIGTDMSVKVVDDPNKPTICTRFDWTDYNSPSPIYIGDFGSPMLTGRKVVIDFGEDAFQVDPTVAIVIPPVPTEGGPGAGAFWGQTSTTAHTSMSETSTMTPAPSSSFTIPSTPKILQQQLENWLRGGSNGVPNILLAFLVGAAFIFIFKKRRN